MSPIFTWLPGLATSSSTSEKSEPPPPPPPPAFPPPPPCPVPPVPSSPAEVDPSPFAPRVELVDWLLPDAADLFVLVCAAARSVNRFVVPRIAPRLDAGAPGVPAMADCAFSAVFVLAVEEFWPEPVAVALEEEDDVDDAELAVEDVELV